MGDLTAHFSRHEFACHHCGRLIGPTASLLRVLEQLREVVGRPLAIVSGYRCPEHNAAVGGKPASQHLLGTAVDIAQGYADARTARESGARGVGLKGGWVTHLDVRRGAPATWTYPS
jgi:uncharacterized protein YcbK (DUF882 family)